MQRTDRRCTDERLQLASGEIRLDANPARQRSEGKDHGRAQELRQQRGSERPFVRATTTAPTTKPTRYPALFPAAASQPPRPSANTGRINIIGLQPVAERTLRSRSKSTSSRTR